MNSILSQLLTIFDVTEWTHTQYDTYKLLKQYVDNLESNGRAFETIDDRSIIRSNFMEQIWFKYSKSKPIISQLLDAMKLNTYTFHQSMYCINLYVVLSFNQFRLNGCLYKNLVNNYINYYIYLENNTHDKAYLTYYTKSTDNELKIKLPEFDKIYQIINIDQSILYQCDLLNFFSEIIMYYDESCTIGDLPIGNDINITLNQLIEKFNNYVSQKNSETNYRIFK